MSKMTVGAVVSEVASITGDSERTIHRRLDTGAGLEIDMVCAFAKVLGVSASHIYKIAAMHHDARANENESDLDAAA